MIGIFDSGSGGLTLLKELKKVAPEYSYLYFGDYKNCPYGNKNIDEIFKLTKAGVLKLKKSGAKLIILACNTAIANSIKKLQNDKNLGVKVLGVTVPGAEKIIEKGFKKVSVLATKSSVENKLYKSRVKILDEKIKIQEISLPDLAFLIEKYLKKEISKDLLKKYILENTKNLWKDSQAILLGCTHYSHIKSIFEELFLEKYIICPSKESAKKLKIYLEKHKEIEKILEKKGEVYFVD